MKGTATLVSPGTPYGVAGQRLYKVDPPAKYDVYEPDRVERETQYVVVSAIISRDAGAETYIFPADEGGNILNWCGLEGSFRGYMDHERALRGAGYTVISNNKED